MVSGFNVPYVSLSKNCSGEVLELQRIPAKRCCDPERPEAPSALDADGGSIATKARTIKN